MAVAAGGACFCCCLATFRGSGGGGGGWACRAATVTPPPAPADGCFGCGPSPVLTFCCCGCRCSLLRCFCCWGWEVFGSRGVGGRLGGGTGLGVSEEDDGTGVLQRKSRSSRSGELPPASADADDSGEEVGWNVGGMGCRRGGGMMMCRFGGPKRGGAESKIYLII